MSIIADTFIELKPMPDATPPGPSIRYLVAVDGDLPPLTDAELHDLAVLSCGAFQVAQAQTITWFFITHTPEQTAAALHLALDNLITFEPEIPCAYTPTSLLIARAAVTPARP